jgi:ankyrin repeat protein
MSGFRVDRRSSVFKAGARRVVPGSLVSSFLYARLIGSALGRQMPPTGPLSSAQIDVIKTWIEQGAEWPNELANEADLPPPNPKAIAMIEALRVGDRASFLKSVANDPKLLNARGPEGSTPFMYAVLYSDAETLEKLLNKGADPNVRNDEKATALMWAATDLAKARVLLAHGADVNAVSADFRTPLTIAAGVPSGAAVVKLLLDHGADPKLVTVLSSTTVPLYEAAVAGNAESMQVLIVRGVDTKTIADRVVVAAARSSCSKCVDLLIATGLDRTAYTNALGRMAYLGDLNFVRLALERGADVNAARGGRTPLMAVAISDFEPVEVAKLLIDHGADVNAKSQSTQKADSGRTALDLAMLRGDNPIVELLVKSGAKTTAWPAPVLKPQRARTIQAAVQRSLPLLQRTGASFSSQAGCVSCHNDSLVTMATALARKSGFTLDEKIAAQQVRRNAAFLEQKRDLLHQGVFLGVSQGDPLTVSYLLIGLYAEHYKPDLNTDAAAMFIRSRQMPDGRWVFGTDGRPPLCTDGDIAATVLSMHALQLYTPKVDRPEYEKAIQRAAAWLAQSEPRTHDDRTWRLLGLAWAGTNQEATRRAMRDVVAAQRPDGGWSDLATMSSTAYATGKALVAVQAAGVPVSDPVYQRAVQFLLSSQLEDGSWYVQSRALGGQPYFDADFPHGVDQWISAAATSWATMALTLSAGGRSEF